MEKRGKVIQELNTASPSTIGATQATVRQQKQILLFAITSLAPGRKSMEDETKIKNKTKD